MNDLSNNTMSRAGAIARTERYFDSGAFKADLARRVAIPSESQNPERAAELQHYIEAEMKPALEAMGFACRILTRRGAACLTLLGQYSARSWEWGRHGRFRRKLPSSLTWFGVSD
jgi:hypothetical protein